MPNLSFGLNIALQSILANSQAIEVTEHNVANANTVGYHRQAPILSATLPTTTSGYTAGQIGGGVTVSQIQRFNLDFFDTRYRSVSADSQNWETQSGILSQLESTLGKSSDAGMLPRMDQFWTDWQNLSGDASNTSLRTNLLKDAENLANGFNDRWQQLNQLRSDQNLAVSQTVDDINDTAAQVASLNTEISRVMSIGEQPNDLLDQRDQALDKLANLAGAVSYQQTNGAVVVSIGGHTLVTGNDSFKLTTQTNPDDTAVNQVVWADDITQVVSPSSGQLKGLFTVRDTIIPGQIDGLNELASNLASQVNAIHQNGFGLDDPASTGLNFFVGDDDGNINAGTIKVNPDLNAENLAASSAADEPGNSDIATQMTQLKDQKVMNGGTSTLNDYYNSQITSLGQTIQSASTNQSNYEQVTQALSDQRQSATGVNQDEEATNLLMYQRGYQAAARIMTVYDDLLDTIINKMGTL